MEEAVRSHHASDSFPWREVFEYLEPGMPSRRREFAFVLLGRNGEETVARHKTFRTAEEFREYLRRHRPLRVDFGALRSLSPSVPPLKELVFDLDAGDYDEVRGCGCRGDGKKYCHECLELVRRSSKVLEAALRSLVGCEDVRRFYSGNRGYHVHARDRFLWRCGQDERKRIAELVSSGLEEAFPVLPEPLLRELDGHAEWAEGIAGRWKSLEDPRGPIRRVLSYLGIPPGNCATASLRKRRRPALALALLRPRPDVQVTTDPEHLLKAPFCAHRTTGKIAAPD